MIMFSISTGLLVVGGIVALIVIRNRRKMNRRHGYGYEKKDFNNGRLAIGDGSGMRYDWKAYKARVKSSAKYYKQGQKYDKTDKKSYARRKKLFSSPKRMKRHARIRKLKRKFKRRKK